MEREIIERLAIDSAAGELNEDTEALFRTYLTEHPESNVWAQKMSLVYGETEAAVTKKTGTLDSDIKTEPTKISHPGINLWPVLRWAAVVIFAACIGAAVGRLSRSDIPQRSRMVADITDSTGKRPVFTFGNINNGFWRDKAVAMLGVNSHGVSDTIIQSNGLWDRYRQYVKEKYNE